MRRLGGNYANVKKTRLQGIEFDSKKEANRYTALRLLERAGRIRNLRRQVPYQLRVNGHLICRYKADFVYDEPTLYDPKEAGRLELWTEVVEDVKGYPNERWPMKKKLFRAIFGKEIRET